MLPFCAISAAAVISGGCSFDFSSSFVPDASVTDWSGIVGCEDISVSIDSFTTFVAAVPDVSVPSLC
uniref:Putative secreted protein n=1 Tax=Anopheles darlingi TaxID=43151 RepID=A0A2M4DJM6_ANODA